MTLKEGIQKQYFLNVLKQHYPKLIADYIVIYKKSRWGNVISAYNAQLHKLFTILIKYYKIPKRIPLEFFKNFIGGNDLVVVLLEHIDYLLKLEGKKSPYGYAAYKISQVDMPLKNMLHKLNTIKGVGKITEGIIREILTTKTSKYYEQLSKL